MPKVIAAINMTVDGVADHTAGIPDAEIHEHYSRLLADAGVILYGRVTYELMLYWKPLIKNPSGVDSIDNFARAIHRVRKIVFSETLKHVDWNATEIADVTPEELILKLKEESDKNIYIGSRSLIIQLLNAGLVDELQLCVHPVVAGSGIKLFEDYKFRRLLTLDRTKVFRNGSVILYYRPIYN